MMTEQEIDQLASKVASKVLEEVADEKGLLLHFTEHGLLGHAIILDEARARATPCKVFTYKGREYAFTKGAIGMLTEDQMREYCTAGKSYTVSPGIKERFEKFAEAAEAAHRKIEDIPKGERLIPWLREMGEELEKRGIEI